MLRTRIPDWKTYLEVADLACASGDYQLAQRMFSLADEEVSLLQQATAKLASSLVTQAQCLADEEQYKKAATLYKRAISLYRGALGCDHFRVAYVLELLAETYMEREHLILAESVFQRAFSIYEETLGRGSPLLASRQALLSQRFRFADTSGKEEALANCGAKQKVHGVAASTLTATPSVILTKETHSGKATG